MESGTERLAERKSAYYKVAAARHTGDCCLYETADPIGAFISLHVISSQLTSLPSAVKRPRLAWLQPVGTVGRAVLSDWWSQPRQTGSLDGTLSYDGTKSDEMR